MKIIRNIYLLPTLLLSVAQLSIYSMQTNDSNNNHKVLEQSLMDFKKQLAELEEIINHKIKSTLSENVTVFHPVRLHICDLINTTIAAGELHYKIDTINNQLLSIKENNICTSSNIENNFLNKITSTTRTIIAKGLELCALRRQYTTEEKNKACIIIAELKKQQQRLIKQYQEKNIPNLHSSYVIDMQKYNAVQRCNYEYDMRKFDKAIREQQIITGDALLPYLWNTNQSPVSRKW